MLHKRNDLLLVEVLRKQPGHIRKLSQEHGLTPSTTMRLLRRLEEENAVSSTIEGRNKIYALKETIEAQGYLFLTEHYKLLLAAQDPELRRVITQLKELTSDELIVLYGSHAKGIATTSSDIDIYIETEDTRLRDDLRLISEKLDIKIGKLDTTRPLAREIIRDHVIIQGVERFYQAIR